MTPRTIRRLRLWTAVGIFLAAVTALALLLRPTDKAMGILEGTSYRYDEARQRLEESHRRHPDDITTLLELARLYRVLGLPEREMEFLRKYLTLRPRDTRTRLELAKVCLWNLDSAGARQQYQAILGYDPDNAEVLRRLAGIDTWEQRYDEAELRYRRLMETGAMTTQDMKALIQVYVSTQKLQQAIPLHHRLWKESSQQRTLADYQELASLYLWTGEQARAEEVLGDMLSASGNAMEAKLACADWFVQREQPAGAVRRLRAWIAERPDEPGLRRRLVDILLKTGDQAAGAAELEELQRRFPDDGELRLRLFWLHAEARHWRSLVNFAATLPPGFLAKEGLLSALADAHLALGETARAIAIWERMAAVDPEAVQPRESLYWAWRKAGDTEQARGALEWLLARRPDDHDLLQVGVEDAQERGDHALAATRAEEGLRRRPGCARCLELLAASRLALGRFDGAEAVMRELWKAFPERFDYAGGVLDACLRGGAKDRAVEVLEAMWVRFGADKGKGLEILRCAGWCERPETELAFTRKAEEASYLEPWDAFARRLALLGQLGRSDEVLALLAQGEKDGLLDARTALGRRLELLAQLGRTEALLALLEQAGKDGGLAREEALRRRMEVLEQAGRIPDALAEAEKLLPLAADREALRRWILERALWLEKPVDRIPFLFRHSRREGPEALALARLLVDQGRRKEALAILDALPAAEAGSKDVLELRLAVAWADEDRKAVAAAMEALLPHRRGAERAKALDELAVALDGAGDPGKALAYAREAVAADPGAQASLKIVGLAAFKAKRYAEAADCFGRCAGPSRYERFVHGVSLLRLGAGGEREARAIFGALLADLRGEDGFERWNMELDIGYELADEHLVDRAWSAIWFRHRRPDIMPRYALHLLYTGRYSLALDVYRRIPPSSDPVYLTLQRNLEPERATGSVPGEEKLAVSGYLLERRDWFAAQKVLP